MIGNTVAADPVVERDLFFGIRAACAVIRSVPAPPSISFV